MNDTNEQKIYLSKGAKITFICLLTTAFVFAIVAAFIYQSRMSEVRIGYEMGIDFTGLCVTYLLALLFLVGKEDQSVSHVLYLAMVTTLFMFFASDIVSWYCEGRPDLIVLNISSSYVAFAISPLLAILFWHYQNSLYPKHTKANKVVSIILDALALVDLFMILAGGVFGFVFSVDDHGNYADGDYISLIYVYPIVLLFVCFIINIFRKENALKKVALCVHCISPTVMGLVSIYTGVSVYMYLAALITMLLLYGIFHIDRGVEMARQNEELMKKEQEIMLSQIQPHFLYNTLNSIYALCKGNEVAQKTIKDFSAYLRTNLRMLNSKSLVNFDEELQHVKTYLSIEKLRFGDKLNVAFDIRETNFSIPTLSLQPLVENAVKHGICKKVGGGTVTVSSYVEGDSVCIVVCDDGAGFDTTKKITEEHVGVANVRQRIKMVCGGTLEITSQVGEGTKSVIKIPKERA